MHIFNTLNIICFTVKIHHQMVNTNSRVTLQLMTLYQEIFTKTAENQSTIMSIPATDG